MTQDTTIGHLDPAKARQLLNSDEAVLIDCREPSEHARERIAGARLVPLSALDDREFPDIQGKAAIFHCRSGARTTQNAAKLRATGVERIYVIRGGIEAWKRAGFPVEFDPGAPIDIMRQVQITAGAMILLGAILSMFASPWFILLSGFVGAGLLVTGITGNCAMASLLGYMPWNRRVLAQALPSN